jgi:hypothetical protein
MIALLNKPDARSLFGLMQAGAAAEEAFCPDCGYFTPHQIRACDGGSAKVCLACLASLFHAGSADICPIDPAGPWLS